jgi:hypothetical protein
MIQRIVKIIAGILAVPIMFGVTRAFYGNIVGVTELSGILRYFIWGIVTYVIVHLMFYKPTYIYVFGHEAVHAIFAWIMGGKIKSFKVSEEGGSVGTDKSNVLIELSPYFVPIYAIILMVVYFVLSYSYAINGAVFIFLIGFALAFHVIMTIEVMKIRQPDIVKSGYFFSIVFVYVLNIVIISLLFSMIFKSFSIKQFFINSWMISKDVYVAIIKQLFF